MIVCCVGGLSCYHSQLACLGATTNEDLRGKFNQMAGVNPYNIGCKGNCHAFWYGGTSRITTEGYNLEIAAAVEPNVFKVVPKTG
jgi:hypothetical protein